VVSDSTIWALGYAVLLIIAILHLEQRGQFKIFEWTCKICDHSFESRYDLICFLRAKWHRLFCSQGGN